MTYNEFNEDPTKLLLGAVNTMLNTIGEADITNEEDIDNIAEAVQARKDLIQTKREVLSGEWDTNTDDEYSLVPDTAGYIPIPANIIRVSSVDSDLVIREHFLYSKSTQSTRFDEPQSVKVVWDIMFNELPQEIRQYITLLAAKRFRDRTLGADATHHGFTAEDARDAYMEARRAESDTTNANMISQADDIQRT
jgi:hypothetical protein